MTFFIIDAFTKELFGGNPAGVVIIPPGGDFPAEETMRLTAAELRYSETAFVKQLADHEFQTRYFTPEAEVDLCGHATIATFYALHQAGLIASSGHYLNRTLAGDLTVELTEGEVYMQMGSPRALGLIDQPDKLDRLYRVMGMSSEDSALRPGWYPEIITTGLPDIILPLSDRDALAALQPDMAALSALSADYSVVGIHAFTIDQANGGIHCRNFAPLYGIPEEAATGTANGALTYYLYRHGWLKAGNETVFIQGEAMKRPSQVKSRIYRQDDNVEIFIGGQAVSLARGEINL